MNHLTESLSSTYKPKLAVIVYSNPLSNEEHYLESHQINEAGQIMEGKPLKQETIQGILDVFFDEQQNRSRVTGMIPEPMIYFALKPGGKYQMIWYRPTEKRFIHFAPALKLKSGLYWVPALLYVVDGKSLNVYALTNDNRPDEKVKLLRAPFHNVNDEGDVCLGSASVEKPKEKTYGNLIKYWEDLFWLSEFTHVNGAEPTKGKLSDAWKLIIEGKGKKKWSAGQLKKSSVTFKSLLP